MLCSFCEKFQLATSPLCFFKKVNYLPSLFFFSIIIFMHTFQLKIIEFVQQIRNPILDEFFKFLNLFDTPIFYLILFPLLWIGYSYRFGAKIFFILMVSSIVNNLLKDIFMQPRPYILDPSVGIIHVLSNYGLPSGAAQTAVILPLLLIEHFKKKKWPIIVGINYFFWISLSRLYLGVHFLTDIIAGWFIGFGLFLVYLYVFPLIEKVIKKYKPINVFWIALLCLFVLSFIPKLDVHFFGFLAVFIGIFLSNKYNMFLKDSKKTKEFFKRAIFAIIGVLVITLIVSLILKSWPVFIENTSYFFMGLWISFFCSYLYKRFFKKYKKQQKK
ncbi:MAG: hypothetical protein K1060chlam1_00370 [Candidatus Anoxychlamydiales bacterium]|nr:hypothetical protein [Candidatus Anoxychlamydiales bacterium]